MPASTATASVPPSARLSVLDGLRGLFLVVMTVGHLRLAEHGIGNLHPAQVSYIDAAHGFVLLSGIVAGLVYGRIAQRQGLRAAAGKTTRRAITLAFTATGLILALAALAWLSPVTPANWRTMMGPLAHPDGGALTAAALYIQHVDYADILPQYVLYLLAAPLVIGAVLRGRAAWLLAISGLIWAGVQFGAAAPFVEGVRWLLARLGPDLYPPRIFNVLAWQFLFALGCAAGVATVASGPQAWRRRLALDSRPLLWLLVAFTTVLAAINLGAHVVPPDHALTLQLAPLVSKERLGLVTLLNVASASWLIAWSFAVAPESAHAFTRGYGRLIRLILNARLLRLLGRHSLLTYVWQVVLIYAAEALVVTPADVPQPARSGLVLVALAALFVPALIKEARRPRPAPARSPDAALSPA